MKVVPYKCIKRMKALNIKRFHEIIGDFMTFLKEM